MNPGSLEHQGYTPYKNCPVRCRNTVWTCPVPDTLDVTRVFCKARAKRVKSFNNCTTNCYVSVPDTFYAKRTPDDFNIFPDLLSVIYPQAARRCVFCRICNGGLMPPMKVVIE
jgi:hypothetical protein